jgi:midasin
MQTLAAATEEQAAAHASQVEQQAEEEDAGDAAGQAVVTDAVEPEQQEQQDEELLKANSSWAPGAAPTAAKLGVDGKQDDEEMEQGSDTEPDAAQAEQHADAASGGQLGSDANLISMFEATTLADGGQAQLTPLLTDEELQMIRDKLDGQLKAASDGALMAPAEVAVHGREVWVRCEALTAGLVGELTEQLRLILEPTLASKLQGDYRTGKRINMKKVGGWAGRCSIGTTSSGFGVP